MHIRARSVFNLFVAAMLMVLPGGSAFSQSNTGRMVGTVYDGSGAVVPGAAIVVMDNATKRQRNAVSDEAGSFLIPLLDIGTYTVTVTAPGFKTFTASDVTIEVGREYPLTARLELGTREASVSVTEGVALINTVTAEIDTTITSTQMLNLPLLGRNPMNLILTVSGSSSNSAQNTSINGQRTAFTNITRDGINVQDAYIKSNATDFTPSRVTSDDVEEFTISTQNATADQGYGGAQIRFVTPRGSSSYHGGAWDYNRNSYYAANDFFNNKAGIPIPFRNRNQFGGKLGGPVPGLKQKLFFFGFYEGLRDVVTYQTTRTLFLPNARNGIFTYVDNAGSTRTVNLFSLVPGITGVDPTVASRLLAKMPTAGNRTDIGDQLNTTGIQLNQPENDNRDTFTSRIDYDINAHHNINGVFSRNSELVQRPDVNNTQGFYGVHPVTQSSVNKEFVLAHRWLISANLSNEVRGGLFFSDVPFTRTNETPAFFITPTTFISNPEVTFLNQGRNVHIWNIQDSAEKIVQRHSLRFGGVMQRFEVNPYNNAGIVPTFTLGTNTNTAALTTSMFPGGISTTQFNNANATFATLGGIVSSGTQSFNVLDKTSGFQAVPRQDRHRYEDYALYINDQWRIKPRLTLNLGLRYEVLTPVRDLTGLGLEPVIPQGADPVKTILDPNGSYNYIGGNAGSANKLYKTDRNNFAPVLSFAYTPKSENGVFKAILGHDSDFVIRGGFRQSFVNDSILTVAENAMLGNVGLGTTSVSALNTATGTSALNARLNSLPAIAPPAVVVPRTYLQNDGAAFNSFGTVFAIDPHIQTTRLDEYNLGVQRSLGWKTVLEVRYVGGRSDNMWRAVDYNQIDIRQNGFADDFSRARRNLIANGNPSIGETLTVFPQLASGGLLTNATVQTDLRSGIPADLALLYIQNQLAGSVKFLPNPNTGVADIVKNGALYRYNSLQLDVRKQFSSGLLILGNYTWQKTLTNGIGTSQTLVDPFLDNANPRLEYTRADYDTAQIFNVNSIYELPVGRGKFFLKNASDWADRILGGWKVSSITRITSGTPITFTDARGTLNRAGRSGRQTPDLAITASQLKALTGHFENANGIYFINPSIVNPATGRAAEGYGTTPFAGQVFFNAAPGATGSLGRAVLDGPHYVNVDAALFKDIRIKEQTTLQLRLDAFNAFNHTNFYAGQLQSINSTSFGKLQNDWGPRVVQIAARLTF
jgi:hypothetical protein